MSFRFHRFFHDGEDVNIDRTMARAAAAADTGDHAVFSNMI